MRASSLSLIKKGELYVSASKALSLVEIDGVYKKKDGNIIVYHEYVDPDLTHTSLQEPFIREYKEIKEYINKYQPFLIIKWNECLYYMWFNAC